MKKRWMSAFLATTLALGAGSLTTLAPQAVHAATGLTVDQTLVTKLTSMLDTDSMQVILTYQDKPTATDVNALKALGISSATVLNKLPMVIATLTKPQILAVLNGNLTNLTSIYADKKLDYLLDKSVAQIGAAKNRATASMGFSGKGIGVAVVDSGIDGTHPDLQYGTRVVQNVKVVAAEEAGDYLAPQYVENVPDTDNGGGHGTHCAGIIGGDGTASGGIYAGVAPQANLIGVSSGAAIMITTAVEGLDYVLTHQQQYNIKVVSNSWGT
ncbi:MAG: S8 family serine peptidase, partial [Tumebacillaceae bacterium]